VERWQRAENSAGSGPLCAGEFVPLGVADADGEGNSEMES